jgi:CheY-like chemotaxis protein
MSNKLLHEMIQGLAILIVEDKAFMRLQTRTMLMNHGAKLVNVASDGLAALETIRISDPDLMVLDWTCRCSTAPR